MPCVGMETIQWPRQFVRPVRVSGNPRSHTCDHMIDSICNYLMPSCLSTILSFASNLDTMIRPDPPRLEFWSSIRGSVKDDGFRRLQLTFEFAKVFAAKRDR